MTPDEIIAKTLYVMSMDMDGDDYDETMDFDVKEIAKELNKLDKNGNLYKCIEQIVEMY